VAKNINVSSLTQLSITDGFLCEILISVVINQNKPSCNNLQVKYMYSDDNGCIQLKVFLRTLIYTSFTFPNRQQLHLFSVNSVALFYFIFQTKNSLVGTAVMMKVSVTKVEF
jgi:hypothetical protein